MSSGDVAHKLRQFTNVNSASFYVSTAEASPLVSKVRYICSLV